MPQLVTPQTLKAIKIVRDHQILSGSAVLNAIRPDLRTCIDVRIGDTHALVCASKVSKWAQSIEKSRPNAPVAILIDGEYLSLQCETSFIRFRSQMDSEVPDVDSVSLVECGDGFLEVPAIPDKESMKVIRAEVAKARKFKAQYKVCERAKGMLDGAECALERSERDYQASLEYLASHSFDEAVRIAQEVRRGRRISNMVKGDLAHDWLIERDRQKVLLDNCQWATDEDKTMYAALRAVAMKKSGRSRERCMRELVSDLTDAVLARSVTVKASGLVKWSYKHESFQHHRRTVATWPHRRAEMLNTIEAAQLSFDEAKALYFEMKGASNEEQFPM